MCFRGDGNVWKATLTHRANTVVGKLAYIRPECVTSHDGVTLNL